MSTKDVGIYQLEDGYWGFRAVIVVDGKTKNIKRSRDDFGNKFKTKAQAKKARENIIKQIQTSSEQKRTPTRRTYAEVFKEYQEKGRRGKAFGTIRKQDSLWDNHLEKRFGRFYVDEVSVAEINDYLAFLYYKEGRSYSYVESFLKMFYLILGQAYSRNYLNIDDYRKLCLNKDSRIKMPKRRIDDENDIVVFTKEEMNILEKYFDENTSLKTAFLLGKYCGLRINECFGLRWSDIDLEKGVIKINRQMSYLRGVIVLIPPKTKNARRTIFMAPQLKEYLTDLKRRVDEAEIINKVLREQNQMILRDSDGTTFSSLELVNTLLNGKIRTVNSVKYHTRIIYDRYGITFRYHYLRHTFGTRLAEMNTPTHLLCNQMGHGNVGVTQRYYLAISKSGEEILRDNMSLL